MVFKSQSNTVLRHAHTRTRPLTSAQPGEALKRPCNEEFRSWNVLIFCRNGNALNGCELPDSPKSKMEFAGDPSSASYGLTFHLSRTVTSGRFMQTWEQWLWHLRISENTRRWNQAGVRFDMPASIVRCYQTKSYWDTSSCHRPSLCLSHIFFDRRSVYIYLSV